MVTAEGKPPLELSLGTSRLGSSSEMALRAAPGNETDQMSIIVSNELPPPDGVLVDIADYVHDFTDISELAYETAHVCLLDALGCGMEALGYPACTKLLGPLVPGTVVQDGARVPGTRFAHPSSSVFIRAALAALSLPSAWSFSFHITMCLIM